MTKPTKTTITPAQLQKRIDAARGTTDADVLLKGVEYLDVFSARWVKGDLALADGVIVGVEPGYRARRVIEGKGRRIVPGFIDAHVHVESSLMVPSNFESAVLKRGTTSAVCDPHELTNVLGTEALQYFLDSSERLSMDLWVMLSSCVPATHMETNGGGTVRAEDLARFASHPRTLGLAEMMNFPGVLNSDPEVLAKLSAFAARPMDGHCPLLTGKDLSAYAAAGISSCHESSNLEEAREKLRKGIAVWIREGSVAKDLDALIPLLDASSSAALGFCTDDRNPLDIAEEGHLDFLIRSAIRHGIAPEVAYRAASWSVARHYGLDRGSSRVGAIAPGYAADLVLLDDAHTCAVAEVFKRGRLVSDIEAATGIAAHAAAGAAMKSVRATAPDPRDLEGARGNVHVIEAFDGKILTGRRICAHDAPGVMRLSVLERYGHGSKPANGYVTGFGNLRGAIASSVGHDSHNLIVVGDRTDDMTAALKALIEVGGGFCVVQDGKVLARQALPFGGLMCSDDPAALTKTLAGLKVASRAIGCELREPFLQLAFLSLPVIPSLKLTDKGLVDVDKFQIIGVGA